MIKINDIINCGIHNNDKMSKIISIEGNIGSGKSSLVRDYEDYTRLLGIDDTKVIFLQEPVDVWGEIKDAGGITILEHFYSDQKKYSFPFQMMAFISRLSLLRKAIRENPHAIIVTERSIFTDRYVFAKMLFDDGKLDPMFYQIYLKWWNEFQQELPEHHWIYIRTTPEICLERIRKRGRKGEDIPIAYLTQCSKYHDEMIFNKVSGQVMVIDGNKNIQNYSQRVENQINPISQFHLNQVG